MSALFVLAINIGLSASYRSTNPYLQGARWASFLSLALVSVARHTYWYEPMLDSFIRLSAFDRPLDWNTVLCRPDAEAGLIVGVTSFLIVIFYSFTPRWPEWTDRWEMLRRAPFTASLGFQVIIATAVIYPTPLTLTSALFFAGVISPILRRQVRLNHIVFLMLTPLFALGAPELATFWGLVCGLIFLYFVAAERTLTDLSASMAFFNGVAFIGLAISTTQSWVRDVMPREIVGFYSLICFLIFMSVAYVLLIRGEAAVNHMRSFLMKLAPLSLRHSSWWNIRDLWVDREVAHRVEKLFKWKDQEKTIGYFVFGPRAWADRREVYDRVPFPHPNLTPAILALPLYGFFQGVDSVLFLTTGQLSITILGFVISFIVVLGPPIGLAFKRNTVVLARAAAGLSLLILGTYMSSIIYFGFTSTENLATVAENVTTASTRGPDGASVMIDEDCACYDNK